MQIIQKNKVEINCGNPQLGNELKEELSSVLKNRFYPGLERLLTAVDQDNTLWQIDKVPIHIQDVDPKNWRTEIVEKSLRQIELFLDAHKPVLKGDNGGVANSTQPVKKINREEHVQNLFLDYLESGVLKPNAISDKLIDILNELIFHESFITRLEERLKLQFGNILRWSLNIPPEIKQAYLSHKKISRNPDIIKTASKTDPELSGLAEYIFWLDVFNPDAGLITETKLEELQTLIRKNFPIASEIESYSIPDLSPYGVKDPILNIISGTLFKKEKSDISLDGENNTEDQPTRQPIIAGETYYINNAGLVLLHPFLKPLFERLEYFEKNNWKDFQLKQRAVLLLQYITNFNSEIFENDLVLNKLLCGMSVNDMVNTKWQIIDKEKELCKDLLSSVIKHWKVLKNTSISGLQESFLQRKGKIECNKSEQFEITVEPQAYDVLLDRLPWEIGVIKTPWMGDYLICNWY